MVEKTGAASVTGKRGRSGFFRVFLRLLFIQGLLNSRGMQNLGFAGSLAAAGEGMETDEVVSRHTGFFNCNPNLTPLVVGAVMRLEEELAAGKPVSREDIDYFKLSLSRPLAALGDMLFIGTLKPMALTLGCLFAIYKSVIGLLAVFLLYNLLIASCRYLGVRVGYSRGWELVEDLSNPVFQKVLNFAQGLGAFSGGVLIAVLLDRYVEAGGWTFVCALLLGVLVLFLIRKDVSTTWFAVFLFVASVLLSLLPL